jgi:hypothetical protein
MPFIFELMIYRGVNIIVMAGDAKLKMPTNLMPLLIFCGFSGIIEKCKPGLFTSVFGT